MTATTRRGTDPLGIVSRSNYDMLGRTTSAVAAYGASEALTTTYTYDADSRLTKVAGPDGSSTSYWYDDSTRITTISPAGGSTTSVSANQLGEIYLASTYLPFDTRHDLQSYDVVGRGTSQTTYGVYLASRVTAMTYDALSRPLSVTDPRYNTTTFAYNDVGRTVTVTDPLSNASTSSYDLAGRTISVSDPLSHSTTVRRQRVFRFSDNYTLPRF